MNNRKAYITEDSHCGQDCWRVEYFYYGDGDPMGFEYYGEDPNKEIDYWTNPGHHYTRQWARWWLEAQFRALLWRVFGIVKPQAL